jgi:hypothetical protein
MLAGDPAHLPNGRSRRWAARLPVALFLYKATASLFGARLITDSEGSAHLYVSTMYRRRRWSTGIVTEVSPPYPQHLHALTYYP